MIAARPPSTGSGMCASVSGAGKAVYLPWVRLDSGPCTFCPNCGVAVVQDFGALNAEAYANGVAERHYCDLHPTPIYLTDHSWPAFKASSPLYDHPEEPAPRRGRAAQSSPSETPLPRAAQPEPPDWEGLRRRGSK